MKEFQKINTYILQLDLITFKYITPLVERITFDISNKHIDQELGKPLFYMEQVNNPELVLLLKCYFFIANQARDSIMEILYKFTKNTGNQFPRAGGDQAFNKFALKIVQPNERHDSKKIKELKKKLEGGVGTLIKTRFLRNFLKKNDAMIFYATNKNEIIVKYKGWIQQSDGKTKQVIDLLNYQTRKPDRDLFFQIMIPRAVQNITNDLQNFYSILLEYHNKISE